MRETNKLTPLKVARLKQPGRYGDGHGLWLQVSEQGSKAWLFRYMRDGRARQMGLGALHTVSLQEARARARLARQVLLDGLDPIDVKHERRSRLRLEKARALTFKQCADDYLGAHAGAWKNAKHRAQWSATLDAYAHPLIGALPVAAIDTALILKILRPIWQGNPKPPAGCAGGSSASWIGRPCKSTGTATILPAGADTSTRCCQPRLRCERSSTIRRCPLSSFPPSWTSSASATAFRPGR